MKAGLRPHLVGERLSTDRKLGGPAGPGSGHALGMRWNELFERARQQHGVVSVADGRACEVSPRRLAARAASDGWERVHPGVWIVAGHPITALSRTAAATITGPEAAASHRSSLWLHGVLRDPPATPQILVPHRYHGPSTSRSVLVHRTRTLPDEHVTKVQGIRAAIVERAILDLAPSTTRRTLRNLVIDAQQRAELSLDRLSEIRRSLGNGRRGLRLLDEVMADLRGGGADSGWEIEVRQALEAVGVTVHPGPFPYRCAGGVVVHLDVAVPGAWVCVELDGRAFHSDRLAFARDRVRWNQISRDWRIVWVTWDLWQRDRAGVIADILAAVRAAEPGRPPAQPAIR
jgi:predicted transcriptional regulator of viral defense system